MTYFGAIMKYLGDENGMMLFWPFDSQQEYQRFIKEKEGILEPVKVPAEQEEFYAMLGYYSAREI